MNLSQRERDSSLISPETVNRRASFQARPQVLAHWTLRSNGRCSGVHTRSTSEPQRAPYVEININERTTKLAVPMHTVDVDYA